MLERLLLSLRSLISATGRSYNMRESCKGKFTAVWGWWKGKALMFYKSCKSSENFRNWSKRKGKYRERRLSEDTKGFYKFPAVFQSNVFLTGKIVWTLFSEIMKSSTRQRHSSGLIVFGKSNKIAFSIASISLFNSSLFGGTFFPTGLISTCAQNKTWISVCLW